MNWACLSSIRSNLFIQELAENFYGYCTCGHCTPFPIVL